MGTTVVAERPGRLEIAGILIGCLLLLVLLGRMDDAAVREEAAKAAAKVERPAPAVAYPLLRDRHPAVGVTR